MAKAINYINIISLYLDSTLVYSTRTVVTIIGYVRSMLYRPESVRKVTRFAENVRAGINYIKRTVDFIPDASNYRPILVVWECLPGTRNAIGSIQLIRLSGWRGALAHGNVKPPRQQAAKMDLPLANVGGRATWPDGEVVGQSRRQRSFQLRTANKGVKGGGGTLSNNTVFAISLLSGVVNYSGPSVCNKKISWREIANESSLLGGQGYERVIRPKCNTYYNLRAYFVIPSALNVYRVRTNRLIVRE